MIILRREDVTDKSEIVGLRICNQINNQMWNELKKQVSNQVINQNMIDLFYTVLNQIIK